MVGTRLDDEPAQLGVPALRGLSRPERVMAIAAALLGAVILALALGLAAQAVQRANAMRQMADAREARLAVYGLMQASIDAETGQRGYLLTDDRRFLDPYEQGQVEALAHLARLRRMAASHTELEPRVRRAEALAHQAFEQLAATIERRPSSAVLRETLVSSKTTKDALRTEARALLREIEQMLEATRVAEQQAMTRLYWLAGMLAAVAIAGVAVTFFALYRERRAWSATFGALEDARARAAASELAKTRFLAVASHDMRQPLHALSLYLSALDRRIENPEARDILSKMERATDSMIAMFSTLLDLARIQAGAVNPEETDFALQDVFDRITAENPQGKIVVAPTELMLRSDPVLLERALRNLVSNALKHGGGNARLSAHAAGDVAEIVVADQGPGISAEDQERIFDEFVRLESRAEGLGLGLSIVRGIAKALDMPLELQSEPGRGARFTLRAHLSRESVNSTAPSIPSEDIGGAVALVVDDDQIAREAIARSLNDLGARVRAAGSEQEAETLLAEGFQPNLLVMDLRLEGQLQGIDIARRLSARLTLPPYVIIVTGDTAADTLQLLQESGFAWLIKPVNPRDLAKLAASQLANA